MNGTASGSGVASDSRGASDTSPSATSRGWVTVAAVTVFVAALATWNSAHKSMWLDESYSMYTATLPLSGAVRHALGYELQPPLYFVLLDLWVRLWRSVMFGRVISTVAVTLFVVTLAAAARRLGVRRWALVGAVTAVLPGVVWAAAELRGYGVVMCLAAVTWYYYLGLVLPEQSPRWRDKVAYVVAAVALLYSFYYGAFVLAGQWAGAVATRRRGRLMTGLGAVIALALAPLVPSIMWQAQQHPLLGPRIDVFADPLHAVGQTILTIIQSMAGNAPIANRTPFLIVVGVVVLATIAARPLAPRRSWSADDTMVGIAALVPVACIGTLRLFDLAPVQGRHFLVALAGGALFIALWTDGIRPMVARSSLLAAVGVILAANLVSFERNAVQTQDWRGAAHYVSAHAAADDKVLVYIPDEILAFGYYYAGRARVYGLPMALDLDVYHAANSYAIRDTTQIADRVAAIGAAGAPRPTVWLLMTHEAPGRPDPMLALADGYLRAHYDTVERIADYDGIVILHAHAH